MNNTTPTLPLGNTHPHTYPERQTQKQELRNLEGDKKGGDGEVDRWSTCGSSACRFWRELYDYMQSRFVESTANPPRESSLTWNIN